jgi:hypothetical protein
MYITWYTRRALIDLDDRNYLQTCHVNENVTGIADKWNFSFGLEKGSTSVSSCNKPVYQCAVETSWAGLQPPRRLFDYAYICRRALVALRCTLMFKSKIISCIWSSSMPVYTLKCPFLSPMYYLLHKYYVWCILSGVLRRRRYLLGWLSINERKISM